MGTHIQWRSIDLSDLYWKALRKILKKKEFFGNKKKIKVLLHDS